MTAFVHSRHPSGKRYRGKFLEGAKGRCWGCGRPREEHREERCPDFQERNDYTANRPQRFNGGATGVVR